MFDAKALDAIGEGGPRAAFIKDTPIGTTVTGQIVDAVVRQVTDYTTGEPQFWESGEPKQQVVITIQTDNMDDRDDDGKRGVYVKMWGDHKRALLDAMRAMGASKLSQALHPGNILTAVFEREEPNRNPRLNATKIYKYRIEKGAHPALDKLAPTTPTVAPTAPATAPTVGVVPNTPQPAPASPADTAKALLQAGIDPTIVASQTGLDLAVVTALSYTLSLSNTI